MVTATVAVEGLSVTRLQRASTHAVGCGRPALGPESLTGMSWDCSVAAESGSIAAMDFGILRWCPPGRGGSGSLHSSWEVVGEVVCAVVEQQ